MGRKRLLLLPFVVTVSPVVIGTGAEILAAEILGAAAFAAGATTVPAGGRVAARVTQGVPPSLVSQPTRHSLNKEIGTIYEIRSSCKKSCNRLRNAPTVPGRGGGDRIKVINS
jgi:hypothetical protein